MAHTQTPGQITANGSEQNLFASQTTLKHYACWLFVDAMAAGDTLIVRVYVNDPQDSIERLYDEVTISGAQDQPAVFFPFVPTDSYRVTIEQTAGTNRTYSWAREETA